MPTYNLNWKYRPADEGINDSVENNIKPIVKFFDASVNDRLIFNDVTWGYGYIDANGTFQDGQWHVTIYSEKANGTTSPISSLSGSYGVKANSAGSSSGKVYSSWLLDKDPETNGMLSNVTYYIAYPDSIAMFVKTPEEYQTEFGTATYIECDSIVHSPLETAFSTDNLKLRFIGYSYNGNTMPNPDVWIPTSIFTNNRIRQFGDNGEYVDTVTYYTGYYQLNYNRSGSTSSNTSTYMRCNYTGYSFNPSVKKTFYSNATENNIVKEYGNAITIDGHMYTSGSYPYVDVAGTAAYAKQIGFDYYRKTSVVVKNATVVTTYNGAETTTTVGSTATEVFSDTGIFTIDGIKLFINKGWGINAAGESTAFRVKTSTGEVGAAFTLLEVNWY